MFIFAGTLSFGQCPILNGNFKTVAICSLTVNSGPMIFNTNPIVNGNMSLSGNISATDYSGSWNGYPTIGSAMSANGFASGAMMLYIDTLGISNRINLKLAITDTTVMLRKTTAAATYQAVLGFTPYNATNPSGYISSVPAQSFSSITGKPTTLIGYGVTDLVALTSGSYSNPSWITALGWSKISSAPTTLSGYGITDAYPLSGNPSAFLTSYTETDPQFNTKLATKTTDNLTEGSNQYFTITRARTSVSAGTGVNYNNSTGVISLPARTMSITTRALNTGIQLSTTNDLNVNYSVNISVTSTLIGTNTGTVFLETSPNNSTWTTVSQSGMSLAGVASTVANTQTIGGFVPLGYYIRIRTISTGANTAVFTYQIGQENTY